MALFGAPTAHEDDPERAVRAALAIRDFALEEELELRVGITTGEALVSPRRAARPRARAWPRATSSTRPRACRAPLPSTASSWTRRRIARRARRSTTTTRRAGRGQGKDRADPCLGGASARALAFGVDVAHEARTELVGRERELGVSARRIRPRTARADPAARDARRRPGHRQEPARLRALPHRRRRSRAHHLAPGPLPGLRRRRHAVGARRDREGTGRHPRAGHAERRRRRSSIARSRTSLAGSGDDARGWSHTSSRSSVSQARQSSAATGGTRPSRPGAASSRPLPSSARSCSSSRTCTGRTRACSTSSTSWSTG